MLSPPPSSPTPHPLLLIMNNPTNLSSPQEPAPCPPPTPHAPPHPRNQTGPRECPLSTALALCPSRCRTRSRAFPSGSSFVAHVNDFHLTKHASRTALLSAADISRLDETLSGYGKKVCTRCNKVCTNLRVHNCSTTPRASPQPRAPRATRTREAPTPSPCSGIPRHGTEMAELDDWPELMTRLHRLRHSYVPSSVSVEYRLFLDRMFRSFNRETGYVKKDLALRTLIAGMCVATRDLYCREAGRRSLRSRAAKMKQRFKTALDGGVPSLLEEAEKARVEEERRASPRPRQSGGSSVAAAKALRFAKTGEYRRAMRALLEGSMASTFDPSVQEGLAKLHPDPCEPVIPIERKSLPPAFQSTPEIVSDVVSKLAVSSSPGPDGMTAHLLKPVLAAPDGPDIPDVDPL